MQIITEPIEETNTIKTSIRPTTLNDYIGQINVKEKISMYIKAAKGRKESLDHILLYGLPGLGKTTLASIIANEMGVNIQITSGAAIEKQGELAAILNNLSEGDILFIDEIHRLPTQVEEVLYTAMEDFAIDVIIGKEHQSRSIRLDLPRFTLIGATTRAGMLSAPLRDRFGIVEKLELYSVEELTTLLKKSSDVYNINIDTEGARQIALRSRGTPRIANRLLRRCRDFADIISDGIVDKKTAELSLNKIGIDTLGLNDIDKELLTIITERFGGGPVGLTTLASALGEDAGTIEDMYEPYLIKSGLIAKTPRGRVATKKAFTHLGISFTEKVAI